MCGIVEWVSRRGEVEAERVHRAVDRLRHRGPDAQSVWVSANNRVALGHSRLSVIDLTTGDQPIADEHGLLRIVVNGESYDFERVRAELEHDGHIFRTRSDSEIALHLHQDRGARSLDALRGEFAFALWDARAGRLFAARDRFGIKPLYYTSTRGPSTWRPLGHHRQREADPGIRPLEPRILGRSAPAFCASPPTISSPPTLVATRSGCS